eukprot:CAMPEP_0203762810 /NCGR_PEP_ID=MMETSP0098-20131031/15607_1 /ASSEMBLY_ACC=CAM_ASM_000208 /TAXON_ID=96639 /ORGANISM=" , Strain NY0313808BC1" /LENGTH=1158 /DNA_ID=CAMNT_0050657361 /DNA_START=242 /DNA_END=3718 /DNA_ORIENTATION=-
MDQGSGSDLCTSRKDNRVLCQATAECQWVEGTGLPESMMGCFEKKTQVQGWRNLCESEWCQHLRTGVRAMVHSQRQVTGICSRFTDQCLFTEVEPVEDILFDAILTLGCKNAGVNVTSVTALSACKKSLKASFFHGEQCIHTAQVRPLCVEKNTNLLGGRLEVSDAVSSQHPNATEEEGIFWCNQYCYSLSGYCTMWTYETSTKRCVVRGSYTGNATRLKKTVHRGYTSGLLCTPPGATFEVEDFLNRIRAERECKHICDSCDTLTASEKLASCKEACESCQAHSLSLSKANQTLHHHTRSKYKVKGSSNFYFLAGFSVADNLAIVGTVYDRAAYRGGCLRQCLDKKECHFFTIRDFYCTLYGGVDFSKKDMPRLQKNKDSFGFKYSSVTCGTLIHAAMQSLNLRLFDAVDLVVKENPFCKGNCRTFNSPNSLLQMRAGVPPGGDIAAGFRGDLYVVSVQDGQEFNPLTDNKYTVLSVGDVWQGDSESRFYTISRQEPYSTTSHRLVPVSRCMYGNTIADGCNAVLAPAEQWAQFVRSTPDEDEDPDPLKDTIMADTTCSAGPIPNPLSQHVDSFRPQVPAYTQYPRATVDRFCQSIGALVAESSVSGGPIVFCTAFPVSLANHLVWFQDLTTRREVMVTSAGCMQHWKIRKDENRPLAHRFGVKFDQCSDTCDLDSKSEMGFPSFDHFKPMFDSTMARVESILLVTKNFAIFTIDRDVPPLEIDTGSALAREFKQFGGSIDLNVVHFYRNFNQRITQYTRADSNQHRCQLEVFDLRFVDFDSTCPVPSEAGGAPLFRSMNRLETGVERPETVVGMKGYKVEGREMGLGVVIPTYQLLSEGFVFGTLELDLDPLHPMADGAGYTDCRDFGPGYDATMNYYEQEPMVREPIFGRWEDFPERFGTVIEQGLNSVLQKVAKHVVTNLMPATDLERKYMQIYQVDRAAIPRYFTTVGIRKIMALLRDDQAHRPNVLQTDISPVDTPKPECRVCCFFDENDDEGKKMSCSSCLKIESASKFYPRLEHEDVCKPPTPAPTPPPHIPVPVPIPRSDRCKVKKPFQPISPKLNIFGIHLDFCPTLGTVATTVLGAAGVGYAGCAGAGLAAAAECQLVGGGPMDPAADACSVAWGGFSAVCIYLVSAGIVVNAATFSAYIGCTEWCP